MLPQVDPALRSATEAQRRQQVRVPLNVPLARARRWVAGAWRDIDATLIDLSSRGVGLSVGQEVRLGDRLSLVVPLGDGQADVRATIELRHVHRRTPTEPWRAGGQFRNLAPADHDRVIAYIAECAEPHASP